MDFSSLNPTYNTTSADFIVKQWLPSGFSFNEPFRVRVSAVQTPSKFHVQLLGPKFFNHLIKIEALMLSYYKKVDGDVFFKNIGELMNAGCGAIFFDNTIHRVCLVRTLQNGMTNYFDDVLVYHCDHGLTNKIKWTYIMKLDPMFCYFPQQAISASLANTVPINNEFPWKSEANNYFYNLVQKRRIEARLTEVNKSEYKMHLLLNDFSKPYGALNVNETLIDAGYAEEGRNIN